MRSTTLVPITSDFAKAQLVRRMQTEEYVIVSAYHGQDALLNTERHGLLRERIREAGYEAHECVGYWKGTAERSFLVFGDGVIADGILWGYEYYQDAIIQHDPELGADVFHLYYESRGAKADDIHLQRRPRLLEQTTTDDHTLVSYVPEGQKSSFIVRFQLLGGTNA